MRIRCNVDAVNQLADFIEQHEELPFMMKYSFVPRKSAYAPGCGTAGCIGGFAAALWPECRQAQGTCFDEDSVRDKLGLDEDQVGRLCFPADRNVWWEGQGGDEAGVEYAAITRIGAVKTLRRLALEGEVIWIRGEQVG